MWTGNELVIIFSEKPAMLTLHETGRLILAKYYPGYGEDPELLRIDVEQGTLSYSGSGHSSPSAYGFQEGIIPQVVS